MSQQRSLLLLLLPPASFEFVPEPGLLRRSSRDRHHPQGPVQVGARRRQGKRAEQEGEGGTTKREIFFFFQAGVLLWRQGRQEQVLKEERVCMKWNQNRWICVQCTVTATAQGLLHCKSFFPLFFVSNKKIHSKKARIVFIRHEIFSKSHFLFAREMKRFFFKPRTDGARRRIWPR